MELNIVTNSEFLPDFMDVVRAFSPNIIFDENQTENVISINLTKDDKSDIVQLDFKQKHFENRGYFGDLPPIKQKSELKRLDKIMLYDIL